MTPLLLLFWLVTMPTASVDCSLWVDVNPTAAQVTEACGSIDLSGHTVRLVYLGSGEIACEQAGTDIFRLSQLCSSFNLGIYQIQVVSAPTRNLACSVISADDPPSDAEILAACGQADLDRYKSGALILEPMGTAPKSYQAAPSCSVPPVTIGGGMFETPPSAEALTTSAPLQFLAGRLIWFGIVHADCDGWSGVDPETGGATSCGMRSARAVVNAWQNRFDGDIYAAAIAENVPASLLKRVLSIESQFWPLWGNRPAGETGIAQLTMGAADTYLRIYGPEDYGVLSPDEQAGLQSLFLAGLRCEPCDLQGALNHERANIVTYARVLRAYRCASTDWRDALVRWNGETYTQRVERGG